MTNDFKRLIIRLITIFGLFQSARENSSVKSCLKKKTNFWSSYCICPNQITRTIKAVAKQKTKKTYVLILIVLPSEPVIYDAQGREVTGIAGPFKEGYDLFLSCHVVGGKSRWRQVSDTCSVTNLGFFPGRPRPTVSWWSGDRLLDPVMESLTSSLAVNQYQEPNVTRALHNSKLQCRAFVLQVAPVLVKEIRIEVYRKCKLMQLESWLPRAPPPTGVCYPAWKVECYFSSRRV